MLSERNRQIAILAATTTLKNNEIADRVGCHYNTVTRVLKRSDVKELISEIQGSVKKKVIDDLSAEVERSAPKAFKKLLDLMENASSPAVQLRAVESILDRSSISPKRQIHSKHEVDKRVVHLHIGGAELERMHRVLLEDAGVDTADVPELPKLDERGKYVVEIDPVTGEILREGR